MGGGGGLGVGRRGKSLPGVNVGEGWREVVGAYNDYTSNRLVLKHACGLCGTNHPSYSIDQHRVRPSQKDCPLLQSLVGV